MRSSQWEGCGTRGSVQRKSINIVKLGTIGEGGPGTAENGPKLTPKAPAASLPGGEGERVQGAKSGPKIRTESFSRDFDSSLNKLLQCKTRKKTNSFSGMKGVAAECEKD